HRGGNRHRAPGVLRLGVRPQSRGTPGAPLGTGAGDDRTDARARRALAPPAGWRGGGTGVPGQVLGCSPDGGGAPLCRRLPARAPLAASRLVLARGTGGAAGRAPGADLEPATGLAIAGPALSGENRADGPASAGPPHGAGGARPARPLSSADPPRAPGGSGDVHPPLGHRRPVPLPRSRQLAGAALLPGDDGPGPGSGVALDDGGLPSTGGRSRRGGPPAPTPTRPAPPPP